MKKDFNTGLRKDIEADRVKLTRRRKLLLREMGGVSHTLWPSSITGAILAYLWFAQGLHSREITEACSFHLCYYQLEPAGSITSRQAYGAGMPAILIICRW